MPIDFKELLPRKVLRIRKGEGSFVFIDLASKNGEEISIWIYMCDWDLYQGERRLISSHDIQDGYEFDQGALDDLDLIDITDHDSGVEMKFSSGVKLDLHNKDGFYSSDDDYFMFFVGEAWVLKYSEDLGFSASRQ